MALTRSFINKSNKSEMTHMLHIFDDHFLMHGVVGLGITFVPGSFRFLFISV